MGHGGPQTYRIPKFVVGSFGLDFVLRTGGGFLGHTLGDLGVSSLVVNVGPCPVIWATDVSWTCVQFAW